MTDLATLDATMLERVLVHGDIESLTPAQRLEYLTALCRSLGLNPLTQPFAYIRLQGKLTLYARRDCADQLRRLHHISITIVAREQLDDIYLVVARATTPDGRSDEAIGAVSLHGLQHQARADAIMKCETKAKRRVTLSLVGLGILDEGEVEALQAAPAAPALEAPREAREMLSPSQFAARCADLGLAIEDVQRILGCAVREYLARRRASAPEYGLAELYQDLARWREEGVPLPQAAQVAVSAEARAESA